MGKGMQIARGAIAAALLVTAGGGALADMPDTPPTQVIAPIFSQPVVWQMPAGFHGGYETTRGDSCINEAVPRGQTVPDWRQIVTVTGLRGAANGTRATPPTWRPTSPSGSRTTAPTAMRGGRWARWCSTVTPPARR